MHYCDTKNDKTIENSGMHAENPYVDKIQWQ